jgi:hypothetical protein
VTLGERSRMTITSSGFLGMSLSDMMLWCVVLCDMLCVEVEVV